MSEKYPSLNARDPGAQKEWGKCLAEEKEEGK